MKKLSKEEWNKRIKELLKASEICRTISDVMKITGYSRNVIQFTLKQFEDETKEFYENLKNNKNKKTKDSTKKIIMLDTSTCQIEHFFNVLEEYIQKGYIIGITDILLDELDNLQKNQNKAACKMLHIILNNITFFKLFEEKSLEEQNSPDERIMRCSQREGTELLTSDKMFCIKAILKGINARYIGQNDNEKDIPNLFFNVKKRKH